MPSWKKLIVSGSNATVSSLFVANQVTGSSFTGSFTGSYSGDGSNLTGISVIGSSNPSTFTSNFTTTSYQVFISNQCTEFEYLLHTLFYIAVTMGN